MMKKILLTMAAVAGFAFSSQAKTTDPTYTGKLEKKATSLSASSSIKSTAVTLSSATEDGKTYKYLHYYKMTLKKGKAYTVWLSGQDAADGKVRIRTCYGMSTWDWNTKAPVAKFEAVDCGVETRWLVTGKKWSDKDEWADFDWSELEGGGDIDWGKVTTPSSWTYYIVVEGDASSVSAKINYIAKKQIPTGVASNPLVIKPSNSIKTSTLTDGFMSEYYYVQVACQKGYCYRFGAAGGSSANVLSFVADDFINGTLGEFVVWTNEFNGAVSFYSNKKQTLTFRLQSTQGYTATGKIKYYVEKQKAIGKHTVKATLKVGKSLTAVPGYLNATNAPAKGCFDMIADEQLFKISLKKDKNYVIETSGASAEAPLIVYLYDSKGTILQKNTSKGSDSPDVRLAYTSTKSTTYYVGVCENHGLFDEFTPKYIPVTLSAAEVKTITKTVKVLPVPAVEKDLPKDKDVEGSPVIALGTNCWYATAKFAATKNVAYAFSVEFDDPENVEANELTVEIYKTKVSSSSKYKMKTLTAEPGQVFKYVATADAMYYLRVYPKAGKGLDYKPFRIHATGYYGDGKACGAIKVTLTGASGKWAQVSYKSGEKSSDLKKRKNKAVTYESGTSVIVPVGKKRVFFTDVKGYTTPKEVIGDVVAGETWNVADGDLYYTDKWDPKDDASSKATKLTISSSTKKLSTHTLWKTDPRDYFTFTAKQGSYYTFKIDGGKGDQVFTLKRVDGTVIAEDVKSVTRVLLPKTTASKYKKTPAKYYLIVSHETEDNVGGKYTLSSRYENLGVVKFSKTTYSVNDTSTTATLSVSRTASKGAVRVRYETVDGTAKDEKQYIAQGGYLSWKDGDKSAKKITVKLIPKTLPLKGKDLTFKVKLTDASQDEVDDGLPESKLIVAVFNGTKTSLAATVKIANKAKYKTVKSAYASVYKDKKTTLKKQESAPLRSGTFYGIVRAKPESALTNGAPEFGSVSLTVTPGKTPALDKFSAKVVVRGGYYACTFTGSAGWDYTNEVGQLVKTLRGTLPICPSETNELTVTVTDGKTSAWAANSICHVELSHFVPDGEGGQRASYSGDIRRNNAKIQAYLDAAFKFDGYYTLSLMPEEASLGSGYLTVTVDAKGGAKVAGLLPDNSSVSATATACAVEPSDASASGWMMTIPVFQSWDKGCIAGELRLVMQADSGRVDGKSYKIVFLGKSPIFWNSDDGVNRDGTLGWRRVLHPCGGWYDKLVNLQGYYNGLAQKFWAESVGGKAAFPAELLSEGYEVIDAPSAGVNLAGNAFSADARKLERKESGEIDFEESVNACNVTVAIKRATGVTTGKASVWASDGELQSEVKGFAHFGVLTMDREDGCGLDSDTLVYGTLWKTVPGRDDPFKMWVFSIPFEIYAN